MFSFAWCPYLLPTVTVRVEHEYSRRRGRISGFLSTDPRKRLGLEIVTSFLYRHRMSWVEDLPFHFTSTHILRRISTVSVLNDQSFSSLVSTESPKTEFLHDRVDSKVSCSSLHSTYLVLSVETSIEHQISRTTPLFPSVTTVPSSHTVFRDT